VATACARLDEQAAEIADRAQRQSFLEEVPEHRQLRALEEDWGA
jgi:hypothetical protein